MELMSGDDGEASLSSAMTNKSDKNMADFDGEESGLEEELARLAAQASRKWTAFYHFVHLGNPHAIFIFFKVMFGISSD